MDEKPGWERRLLEKLAMESLVEQRRRRRWGVFFKSLTFLFLGVVLYQALELGGSGDSLVDGKRHTALVQLDGVIREKSEASAERVMEALQDAFEGKGTAGVILRINSPGGSPVQSGMIYDEIRRLRAKYPKIPLHVVVEDICASGGYYVAAAADGIYVDKASIVGSIGVLMDGFGFVGAMDKLGVERRLLTAGENKGFLDPFSPQQPKQLERAREMLNEVHQQFIEAVRKGRGKRLKETPDMFSGLMWTGARSVDMGLADGLGTVDSVARDVIKAEDVRDYTLKRSFAERFAGELGSQTAAGLSSALGRWTMR
ncbi:MAG: S49 family peptidase [Rhodocyclaceae bacterium]|nr:S49 family peptidase [Rhodocyclaceae bacterium]